MVAGAIVGLCFTFGSGSENDKDGDDIVLDNDELVNDTFPDPEWRNKIRDKDTQRCLNDVIRLINIEDMKEASNSRKSEIADIYANKVEEFFNAVAEDDLNWKMFLLVAVQR